MIWISALVIGSLIAAIPFGFALNGLVLAKRERPHWGVTAHPPAPACEQRPAPEIKIFALNLAKAFAQQRGFHFERCEVVQSRLKQVAAAINAEQPDIVFLSEVFFECSPCPVNQVTTLAEQLGMHAWTFGENYNFGLPFYRIVAGNAILSRWLLEAVANPNVGRRKAFYRRSHSHRLLWSAIHLRGQRILLGAVHNDSRDRFNNLAQMDELLERCGRDDVILAGDFNAEPHHAAMRRLMASGRFVGAAEGPATFPADDPMIRIDYVFAPANWELLEHRVIANGVSDHLGVLSVFRLPGRTANTGTIVERQAMVVG